MQVISLKSFAEDIERIAKVNGKSYWSVKVEFTAHGKFEFGAYIESSIPHWIDKSPENLISRIRDYFIPREGVDDVTFDGIEVVDDLPF